MTRQELLEIVSRGYPGHPELLNHGLALIEYQDGTDAGNGAPYPVPTDTLAQGVAQEALNAWAPDLTKAEVLLRLRRVIERQSIDLRLICNEMQGEIDEEILNVMRQVQGD